MFRDLYLVPLLIFIFSYIFIYLGNKKAYNIFLYLIYGGFAAQSALLFGWLYVNGFNLMPVDNIVFFNAWLLMVVVVLFTLFYRARYILVYITPVVALNLLIAFFAPHNAVKPLAFQGQDLSVLLLHIILVLIGDSIFALAFIISLIYILQERKIKLKKNLKLFNKKEIPFYEFFYLGKGYNLELLDSINYQCLKIGFPLITLGIAVGIYLSSSIFKSFMIAKPIEIISLITWLIYAVLLHERIARGVRGKKAAVFSIIGFLFIVSSLSFSLYLFPKFHGLK